MKAKGYKTSPTIHVPKATVAKMHAAAAAAAAQKRIKRLESEVETLRVTVKSLEGSISAAAVDVANYVSLLRTAVSMIDEERSGTKAAWSIEDVRKLEAIRALTIF